MKIPYAIEQGSFFVEQGSEIPCSTESRDISRPTRRLLDALRTQAQLAKGRRTRIAGTEAASAAAEQDVYT